MDANEGSWIKEAPWLELYSATWKDHPLFKEIVLALKILVYQMNDLNNNSNTLNSMFDDKDSS